MEQVQIFSVNILFFQQFVANKHRNDLKLGQFNYRNNKNGEAAVS